MRNIKKIIQISCFMIFLCGCGQDVSFVSTQEQTEEVSFEDYSVESVSEQSSVEDNLSSDTQMQEPADMEQAQVVAVYVCGAVNNPGVYYLDVHAIKQAAIEQAGGFSESADQSYVNLAQPVSEGERIYVPTLEETEQLSYLQTDKSDVSIESVKKSDTEKININTATKEQLMTLPGIGENKANAIIEYRQTQGMFKTIDEIMRIDGIKEGVYNKIKNLIIV